MVSVPHSELSIKLDSTMVDVTPSVDYKETKIEEIVNEMNVPTKFELDMKQKELESEFEKFAILTPRSQAMEPNENDVDISTTEIQKDLSKSEVLQSLTEPTTPSHTPGTVVDERQKQLIKKSSL